MLGETAEKADEILKESSAKSVPLDAAQRATLPKIGRWLRYDLGGKVGLFVNLARSGSDEPERVSVLVVEAEKPLQRGNPAKRVRIEFEAIDLKKPLEGRWSWAIGDKWTWNPKDPRKAEILKRRGQRR